MGSLPEFRVAAPFQHVDIDYGGPIQMRCSRGRGQISFKSYIAVFVCMTFNAIHLEAVSDITSEAFMAALKRFCGAVVLVPTYIPIMVRISLELIKNEQ